MSPEEPVEKEEIREEEEEKEVKELEIVKGMISEWLDKIGVVIKDIVSTVTSSIDGRRLSEEIVEMYKRLKEAGLPDDVVSEIIRDFYKRKLDLVPSLKDLISTISDLLSKKRTEADIKMKETLKKEE